MLNLAIECSASQLVVGLIKNKKLLEQEFVNDGFSHSELLIVKINQILEKNNYQFNDLDLVTVVNGPASFTALRVALTVAKIINISLQKPVITVNKCELLAYIYKSNLDLLKIVNNKLKLTTIVSAGGAEVFLAKYSIINQQINIDENLRTSSIEELLINAEISDNLMLFADEEIYLKFKTNFSDKLFLIKNDVLSLGLFGLEKFHHHGADQEIKPIYLVEPRISKRKS